MILGEIIKSNSKTNRQFISTKKEVALDIQEGFQKISQALMKNSTNMLVKEIITEVVGHREWEVKLFYRRKHKTMKGTTVEVGWQQGILAIPMQISLMIQGIMERSLKIGITRLIMNTKRKSHSQLAKLLHIKI